MKYFLVESSGTIFGRNHRYYSPILRCYDQKVKQDSILNISEIKNKKRQDSSPQPIMQQKMKTGEPIIVNLKDVAQDDSRLEENGVKQPM